MRSFRLTCSSDASVRRLIAVRLTSTLEFDQHRMPGIPSQEGPREIIVRSRERTTAPLGGGIQLPQSVSESTEFAMQATLRSRRPTGHVLAGSAGQRHTLVELIVGARAGTAVRASDHSMRVTGVRAGTVFERELNRAKVLAPEPLRHRARWPPVCGTAKCAPPSTHSARVGNPSGPRA